MLDAMIAARDAHPAVAATLDEASEVLDQDLVALIATGPVDELGLTTNTQPVMLAAGVAMWRAWRDAGGHAAGAARGSQPRRVRGARRGRRAVVRRRAAAGALSAPRRCRQAVPVGTGGMAAILGPRRRRGPRGLRRGGAGRGRRGRQLQRAVAGRRRGTQGRGRARVRGRESARREARGDPRRVGAVPFVAAEAGRRAARGLARRRRDRRAGDRRRSTTSTWRSSTTPRRSAMRWSARRRRRSAGPRSSGAMADAASRRSSSAVRARCSRRSASASIRASTGLSISDPASLEAAMSAVRAGLAEQGAA